MVKEEKQVEMKSKKYGLDHRYYLDHFESLESHHKQEVELMSCCYHWTEFDDCWWIGS